MRRRGIVFRLIKKYSDRVTFFIVVLALPDIPDKGTQKKKGDAEADQGEQDNHTHKTA
jgi:hypothetical protein